MGYYIDPEWWKHLGYGADAGPGRMRSWCDFSDEEADQLAMLSRQVDLMATQFLSENLQSTPGAGEHEVAEMTLNFGRMLLTLGMKYAMGGYCIFDEEEVEDNSVLEDAIIEAYHNTLMYAKKQVHEVEKVRKGG